MQSIVREGQRFVRRVVTDDEARIELADEPFKLELIGLKGGGAEAAEGASVEVGEGELTIYDNVTRDGDVAWKDLCRGPHSQYPHGGQRLGADACGRRLLARVEEPAAAARIYGTAWPSKDEMRAYQERLAEAERRDHRKLDAEWTSSPSRTKLVPASRLPPQGWHRLLRDRRKPAAGTCCATVMTW